VNLDRKSQPGTPAIVQFASWTGPGRYEGTPILNIGKFIQGRTITRKLEHAVADIGHRFIAEYVVGIFDWAEAVTVAIDVKAEAFF
jgi:hypothetical protein